MENEIPDTQGFSSRNLRYIKKFYDFYKTEILHQVDAKLEDILFTIPWRHHIGISTYNLPSEKEIAERILEK